MLTDYVVLKISDFELNKEEYKDNQFEPKDS